MKSRILMIVSFFYPSIGGAEQQVLLLSKGLIERGYSVSVLTRSYKGLDSFEMIQGIPVYRKIETLSMRKCFAITYMLSVLWFLYKKRNSYDVIHCHILHGFHSIVALFFKRFYKKRVIIKVAATGPLSDFASLKNIFLGKIILKIIRNADRIVTVCSQSKQEAIGEGIPHSSVIQIPNGVDTHCFKPVLSDTKSRNNIIFVGRLDSMKGVDVLIEAFKKLWDEGLHAHLDIVGDGPEKNSLQYMVEMMGINDGVSFYGEVQNVMKFMQKADLFVLPSLSEGLSNVILEAMACGLPVVATRVGGNTDLIQDGINGILVDSLSQEQLKGAIKELLEDTVLAGKLAAEARRAVEKKYSIEQIVDQYVSLYSDIFIQ